MRAFLSAVFDPRTASCRPPTELHGRVIPITGASQGIGRAVALSCAAWRHACCSGAQRAPAQRGARPDQRRAAPSGPRSSSSTWRMHWRATTTHCAAIDRALPAPGRPAAQRRHARAADADRTLRRTDLVPRAAGEPDRRLRADADPAAAAEAFGRRLDRLHRQQRGPQRSRLLGRLRGVQVRPRGLERGAVGGALRASPRARQFAEPGTRRAPRCAARPIRPRTRAAAAPGEHHRGPISPCWARPAAASAAAASMPSTGCRGAAAGVSCSAAISSAAASSSSSSRERPRASERSRSRCPAGCAVRG